MVVAVVPRPAGTHDDGSVARLRPRRRKKGGSAEGKRGLQRSGMLLLRGFLRPSSSPLVWAAPSTGCPCSHRFRFPSPPLWTALRSGSCTNLASGIRPSGIYSNLGGTIIC